MSVNRVSASIRAKEGTLEPRGFSTFSSDIRTRITKRASNDESSRFLARKSNAVTLILCLYTMHVLCTEYIVG